MTAEEQGRGTRPAPYLGTFDAEADPTHAVADWIARLLPGTGEPVPWGDGAVQDR